MAEEHTSKAPELESNVSGEGAVESKERGLFDFMGKKEEEKPQEEVIVTEFEKVNIEETKAEEEGEEKKKHGLLEKLHRSDSSSSSSSSDEEEGEGEEKKKKKKKEKKGLEEKIEEKLEGEKKEEDTSVPVEKCDEPVVQPETPEKKGFLEKIKEKLPGQHKKAEEASSPAPAPAAEPHVLPAVIERIPPPPGSSSSPLRMLLLDSYYDEYKGVICHVAAVDGALRKGDKISSAATGQTYEVLDIGIMHPELTPTGVLLSGQVGYVVTGMRSTKEARIGDTLYHTRATVEPLPGFKPAKHMVFSGLYPADGSDFDALNHAIERLTCNDASVSITKESSTALGLGFRCGFLGLLHMDVFHQRLEQEHEAHVISTVPTVPYIFEYSDGSKVEVQNPAALFSDPKKRLTACWEPTVIATIIIPSEYVGPVITLCSERRGQQLEYSFIDSQRAFMKYRLPLREIVVDFYNELKSITSGYASFDYEDSEYQQSDLVKLDILLNGKPVDAMATIVHSLKAQRVGRELVDKLKKFIDRQMFEIIIQAAIGSKVIARETISAMRKNVLAKCYGGDVTRKRKLLEKQKEGKKRMKRVGSVDIPQEAFHQLLKVS